MRVWLALLDANNEDYFSTCILFVFDLFHSRCCVTPTIIHRKKKAKQRAFHKQVLLHQVLTRDGKRNKVALGRSALSGHADETLVLSLNPKLIASLGKPAPPRLVSRFISPSGNNGVLTEL